MGWWVGGSVGGVTFTWSTLNAALHAGRGTGHIVEHLIADERGQRVDTDARTILGICGASDGIQQSWKNNRGALARFSES